MNVKVMLIVSPQQAHAAWELFSLPTWSPPAMLTQRSFTPSTLTMSPQLPRCRAGIRLVDGVPVGELDGAQVGAERDGVRHSHYDELALDLALRRICCCSPWWLVPSGLVISSRPARL